MSVRRVLFGLAAYAFFVVLSVAALVVWLSLDSSGSRGPYVVSAWRNGSRVARVVTSSDPKGALAREQALPGTTIVVDRILAEAPIPKSSATLFALSVRPGSEGVLAKYEGRVAYLTPDDLVASRAYRSTLSVGWLRFGARIDPGAVVARLSRELRTTSADLWSRGTFRRFVASHGAGGARLGEKPEDASVTPKDLATDVKRAADFLAGRVDDDGRLVFRGTVAKKDYDWALHARVVVVLARASAILEDRSLRATARRAARRLSDATGRCGEHRCIGDGARVDTASSAEALYAFTVLAAVVPAQAFLQPTRSLSEFLRSQQRATGVFASHFDRAHGAPYDDPSTPDDPTALAARSLAAAHRVTRNRDDLLAAQRGSQALVRAGRAPIEPYASSDARAERSLALSEIARLGAPVPGARESSVRWALGRSAEERGDRVGDFRGGYRSSPFGLPETASTSRTVRGLIAVVRSELGSRAAEAEVTRSLALEIADALSFLSRQSLPGARAYLFADPNAAEGAFAKSPLDVTLRLDDTERAASAMLDYLAVAQERDPDRAKRQRRAPPPLPPALVTPLPVTAASGSKGLGVGR